jgi:class 3 adenylate cyclase
MPELEALTDVRPASESAGGEARQFATRFPLTAGKSVRLGQAAAVADWAIPEDNQISRYHAVLLWDGEKLVVRERDVTPPEFPRRPMNRIFVPEKGKPGLVEAPGNPQKCEVRPGEWFWIGQTRFTVRGDEEAEPDSPVDGTITAKQEERTRDQLEELPFADPKVVLKAMEQLPRYMKAATTDQGLFRQMLQLVMDALPRADAAAVVRLQPAEKPGEIRLAVAGSNVRPAAFLGGPAFAPSRKLAHRAIVERKRSVIYCWSTDPKDLTAGSGSGGEMTLAVLHEQNLTPWAICTPFQDGSRYALYVAGRAIGRWAALDKMAQARMDANLAQYQKVAELVVGLIETTLRMNRLSRQNAVIRRAWPQGIWKYLDDPDKLEAMLKPQEKEVTILCCDLRNYSTFASRHSGQLLSAQREVSLALSTMSSAITDRDGVVVGFQGDAVLGFWGWPDPDPGQVVKAARVALAIRGRLADWTLERRCGLGLTHGTAVAGRLGAHDLAVVDLYGPVVNLAFRLEAMTKAFGVEILVTLEVAERLAAADPDGAELRTRKLGVVRVKGFPDPVPAFELYAAHSPTLNEFQRHEWDAAVELFTGGQWAEADDLLSQLFPDDPAAKCLRRAMDKAGWQPPADWDGSFVPPE